MNEKSTKNWMLEENRPVFFGPCAPLAGAGPKGPASTKDPCRTKTGLPKGSPPLNFDKTHSSCSSWIFRKASLALKLPPFLSEINWIFGQIWRKVMQNWCSSSAWQGQALLQGPTRGHLDCSSSRSRLARILPEYGSRPNSTSRSALLQGQSILLPSEKVAGVCSCGGIYWLSQVTAMRLLHDASSLPSSWPRPGCIDLDRS